MNKKVIYTIAGFALLLLIFGGTMSTWYNLLRDYFIEWEKFSATPYWDVKRWSWGYGTRVPGSVDDPNVFPGGSITRWKAFADAYTHAENDYDYLQGLITVPLTGKQWAALLSFSYNLGPGNADNLVENINTRNWTALKTQWLQYNKADGEYRQHLADRREFEINNFLEDTTG